MSRIGKMPIPVPAGVDVTIDGQTVTVKGPKGELTRTFLPSMTITRDGDELIVTRPDDTRESKSAHGLTRTLLANMVEGVSNGFSKKLQLVGVGYRAALKGGALSDRDRRVRSEQGAGRPGCREHPQVAQAGALQGQGHSLRGRACPPQGWQGRQRLSAYSVAD